MWDTFQSFQDKTIDITKNVASQTQDLAQDLIVMDGGKYEADFGNNYPEQKQSDINQKKSQEIPQKFDDHMFMDDRAVGNKEIDLMDAIMGPSDYSNMSTFDTTMDSKRKQPTINTIDLLSSDIVNLDTQPQISYDNTVQTRNLSPTHHSNTQTTFVPLQSPQQTNFNDGIDYQIIIEEQNKQIQRLTDELQKLNTNLATKDQQINQFKAEGSDMEIQQQELINLFQQRERELVDSGQKIEQDLQQQFCKQIQNLTLELGQQNKALEDSQQQITNLEKHINKQGGQDGLKTEIQKLLNEKQSVQAEKDSQISILNQNLAEFQNKFNDQQQLMHDKTLEIQSLEDLKNSSEKELQNKLSQMEKQLTVQKESMEANQKNENENIKNEFSIIEHELKQKIDYFQKQLAIQREALSKKDQEIKEAQINFEKQLSNASIVQQNNLNQILQSKEQQIEESFNVKLQEETELNSSLNLRLEQLLAQYHSLEKSYQELQTLNDGLKNTHKIQQEDLEKQNSDYNLELTHKNQEHQSQIDSLNELINSQQTEYRNNIQVLQEKLKTVEEQSNSKLQQLRVNLEQQSKIKLNDLTNEIQAQLIEQSCNQKNELSLNYKSELEQLHSEIEALKKTNENNQLNLNGSTQEKQKLIIVLEKEKEELKLLLSQKEKQIQRNSDTIDKLFSENKKFVQATESPVQIQNSENPNESELQWNYKIESMNKEFEKQKNSLLNEIDVAKETANQEKLAHQTLKKSNDENLEQIQNQHQNELQELQKSIHELHEEIKQNNEDYSQKETELNQVNVSAGHLKNQILELEQDLNNQKNINQGQQENIKRLEIKIQKSQQEYEALQNILNQKNSLLDSMNEQNNQINAYEIEIQKLKQEIKQNQSNIQELKDQYDLLNEQNIQLSSNEKAYQKLKQDHQIIENELQQKQDLLDSINEQNNQLNGQETEILKLKQVISIDQNTIKEQENQIALINEQNNIELREQEKEIQNLRQEIHSLQEQEQALKNEINSYNQLKEKIDKDHAVQLQYHNRLKIQFTQKFEKFTNEYQEKINQLQILVVDKDKTIEEQKVSFEQVNTQIFALENLIEDNKQLIDEQKQTLNYYERSLAEMTELNEQNEEKLIIADRKNSEISEKITAYEQQVSDQIQNITSLEYELQIQEEDLKLKDIQIKQKDDTNKVFQEKIKSLSQDIFKLMEEQDGGDSQRMNLQKEKEKFEHQQKQLEQLIEEGQNQLNQTGEQQQKLNDQIKEQIEKIAELNKKLANSLSQEFFKSLGQNFETNFKEFEKLFENCDLSELINEINNKCVKLTQSNEAVNIKENYLFKEISLVYGKLRNIVTEKIKNSNDNVRKNEKVRYDKLAENFQKLQQDLQLTAKQEEDYNLERGRLEGKIIELNEKIEKQMNEVSQKELQIKQFNLNQKEFFEETKKNHDEINQLKAQQKKIENFASDLKAQIARLEGQLSQKKELQKQMQSFDDEKHHYQLLLEMKIQEIQSLNSGIANLQAINEENQQRSEQMAQQYDTELQKSRADCESLKKQNENYDILKLKSEELELALQQCQKALKIVELKYRECEASKNEVEMETNEILQQIKSDTTQKDNMVDRRVISNFLITYFDLNTSYPVKLQILDTLSSVLFFSQDERLKIGLHQTRLEKQIQNQGEYSNNSPTVQQPQNNLQSEKEKSLKDQFINFLIDSDDDGQ